MPLSHHNHVIPRPTYLKGRHLQTVVPSFFNSVKNLQFKSERLELVDGDFLDLHWSKHGHRRLLIACHGLEGNATRHYIKRSAQYFIKRDWDYLAWDYRSCSEEMNRLPKMYAYGDIGDLVQVVDHALCSGDYDQIVLLGFSMGGCLVNKYLGTTKKMDARILGGISASVSCDLLDSVDHVENNYYGFYNRVFVGQLKAKLKKKAQYFDEFKDAPLHEIKSFSDFHQYYSIPYHQFDSLEDYYWQSSCQNFFDGINKPSLIINALNDPILGDKCYPREVANEHDYLHLETPDAGGHLGFSLLGKSHSWMEERAEKFINEVILMRNG